MKKYNELISSAIIFAISVFLYFQTSEIPAPRYEPLGSAFFPRIILVAITLLAAVLFCKNFFKLSKEKDMPAGSSYVPEPTTRGNVRKKKYVLGTITIFGVYILLVSITEVHFLLLTFCFIFISSWFLAFFKLRTAYHALGLATALTFFIYMAFQVFLKVFFP